MDGPGRPVRQLEQDVDDVGRLAQGQDPKPPVAGVDQAKVDAAIEKGIAFLKAGDSPSVNAGNTTSNVDPAPGALSTRMSPDQRRTKFS